jgi:hypothetical protein
MTMSQLGNQGGFSGDLFQKVQNDAVQRMSLMNAKKSNLYIQREVLREGTVIQPRREEIRLRRETVMVFCDDAPYFNWSHPCRYLFYDTQGEPYDQVFAKLPPYLTEAPETFGLFHEPVPILFDKKIWPVPAETPRRGSDLAGDSYAVLFSGASDNRHTNDMEFLYRTLVDVYGYREENIYVLNYDGTVNYANQPQPPVIWPGDNTPYRMRVSAPGTKQDFEDVLDELKRRLAENDSLLIHTNNHGWYDGTQSQLITYSGPDYSASDLADKVSQLPRFGCLAVMMEQCNSGGFVAPLIARSPAASTSVAAACDEHASSIGGPEFDPFARDWIAAMFGTDPHGRPLSFNPDVDGNGGVTTHEAFNYAFAVKDPFDTPVFKATPSGGDCKL